MASKGGGKVGGGGTYLTAKDFTAMGISKDFLTAQPVGKQDQAIKTFYHAQNIFLDPASADQVLDVPFFKTGVLNSADRTAISIYTDDGFRPINRSLYEAKAEGKAIPGHLQGTITDLDTALTKLPSYKGAVNRSMNVHAGSFEKFLSAYKKGKTVTFPSYTSTSTGPRTGGNVHYKIVSKGKNGKTILNLSEFSNEREILFARGSKFRVGKVIRSGHDGGSADIVLYEI